MTDTDSILIGTEWIKVAAKHHGQKGRIDNLGPRGPRMFLVGTPIGSRHGSRKGGQPMYQRLDWFELGNTWEPYSNADKKRYDLWQTTKQIELMDNQLEQLNSVTESISQIMTPELPQAFVECHSVYHSSKNKQVPQDQAYMSKQGNWWCLECRGKRDRYEAARKAKETAKKERLAKRVTIKKIEPIAEYVPPKIEIEPVVEVQAEWRVTIIERIVHVVRASDFLEAAAQVSEKGEIVKVERI